MLMTQKTWSRSARLTCLVLVPVLAPLAARADEAPPPPASPGPPAAEAAGPAEPAGPIPAIAPEPPAPAAAAAPAATIVSYPTMGKSHEIRLSDDVWFRLGLQAQAWADFQQDANVRPDGRDGGYAENLFFRRVRVIFGAQLYKNVNVFLLLDSPNLGKATGSETNPKTFGPVIVTDAFAEVRFHEAFALQGGLMLVPLTRNILQSTTTYLGLDFGNTSAIVAGPTQTSGLRDAGFQATGQLFGQHLEYRVGIFQGVRNPAPMDMPPTAAAQNPFRLTGYLQANFFDPEKGYVFNGTYFGKKKVLGIALGSDYQKGTDASPYYALSTSAFAAIPLAGAAPGGGDEIAGLLQLIHYDGEETLPAIAAQNDVLAEAAYYNKALHISVFGKLESKRFSDEAAHPGNTVWMGGGFKYYVAEASCNFTFAYNRAQFPDAGENKNSTNQLTAQMQLFYY
jgi:hypothetical protein